MRAALLEAAAQGSGTLVVDMAQTQFCDSAALNVLVRAHNRAQAEGGELLPVIGGSAVLRTFAVTGIGRLIPSFPSLEQALAAAPAVPDFTSPPGVLTAGPAPPAVPEPLGTPLMTSSGLLAAADIHLVEDDPGDVPFQPGRL